MRTIESPSDLQTVLSHPSITDGEHTLLKWQHGGNGHFFTALWEAIIRADLGNLRRLEAGFPSEVQAYRDFAHAGDFAKKVDRILSTQKPQPIP